MLYFSSKEIIVMQERNRVKRERKEVRIAAGKYSGRFSIP